MCLAIPVKVVELLEAEQALVDVGGVRKEVDVSLVDGVQAGDYVILHVGFAINRLDEAEAERTLSMLREMGVEPGAAA
ncbi:HypC/HybG/HupF family hydrogenase formation chaperone [Thioalkalivibrio paradoxus]|uniref:Hydrogenase assembly protein HupF n=1 Tax=Thioalkalivibrio paradoxus ARh 1 TaxID=713585 RepID=W0DHX6_9GAMM|nr:HypC/HybG/HupF family hydrogenase formation chaperone [Thioalkalivibrio paradoxus]AHE98016.1 hydrogenase assembly protein HupF [Thioalkalivibrio paradoxus ARh 1]